MHQNLCCKYAVSSDADFIYKSLFDMAVEEGIGQRFQLNQKELSNMIFGENRLADVIIAELDHTPVGLVVFSETNRNFTLFQKPGMYVHDIYVLPSHRGNGVATYLGKELQKIANERNYGRIDWVVLNDNDLGKAFFSKLPDATKIDYIQCMRLDIS